MPSATIDLVVSLEKFDSSAEYARVGIETEQFMHILEVDVPKIVLPVKEGRTIAVLIESAVTNFRLKEMGFDSAKAFENRVYDYIERQNAANAAVPETEKE